MRVFVDEDAGSGLAKALIAAGIADVDYVGRGRLVQPGSPDVDWLPIVGDRGDVVLSRNRDMLRVEAERACCIKHRIGIVFMPGRITGIETIELVLRVWPNIELINLTERRPFAFRLRRDGSLFKIAGLI